MAGKKKVTDAQIIECVEAGMTYHDIAKKYGMNHQSVYQRIKQMRDDGRLPDPKSQDPSGVICSINKMDTVVRLKDRKWFRVTEVSEKYARLVELQQGESLTSKKEVVDIRLEVLLLDYEKKDYPQVKCYNMNEIALGVDPNSIECCETVEEPVPESEDGVEINISMPDYDPADVAFPAKNDDVTITIPKGVAESLADFIEWDVFDRIRNDTDIDNIHWLCGICDAYKELRKQVG